VAADGVLGDDTVKAVAARDAKQMIAAICDERLRFLQSLRTWPVFGKGWGRRVAEVKTVALAMAASAPMPDIAAQSAQGRAVVPVQKAAQQGTAGALVAAGAAAAQQAHQSGFSAGAVVAILFVAVVTAIATYAFWRRRQKQQQEKPA
jgi:lysozyme family protein